MFNEHNGLIMSAHEDKMIRFMDPNSGTRYCYSDKIIKSLVAHTDSVTSLTFQAKSYEFSSSSHDGSLRAWDIRKFKCLSHVPIHCRKYDEAANCLLQHPQDMIIAVGGADGIVKMLYESD
jgi:striatin 1/3/4